MQTIARANRVFSGKHSGTIVDYANVFASLEKALAIYGVGKGGESPVRDKKELLGQLRDAIREATAFCARHRVSLADIQSLPAASMDRLQAVDDAMDALIAPDDVRREFFGHERLAVTLYKAVLPDPAALEFIGVISCMSALVEAIKARLDPDRPDITGVMGAINDLLDESITGITIRDRGPAPLDLSKIDFNTLAERFKKSRHKNTEIEMLKAAIRARLERLVQLNPTRADFGAKFEELIEGYNAGSRSIEDLFQELLKLSRSLDVEQERHVRESMSEEELVIFDILTRPAPELSAAERAEVKKVARVLLASLKRLLIINWRQKSAARATLRIEIENVLDIGLPRAYTPEVYKEKCAAVFEHMYECYPERDTGIYSTAS
jgi:type I restriction enzyme R subunit